jgi:phage gp36-like protein
MAYATRSDFERWGLSPSLAAQAETKAPGAIANALDARSAEADSYFRARYVLPLTAWDANVRRVVCELAALDVLGVAGFNPQGNDEYFTRRAERALGWLKSVGAKRVHPDVTESGAPVDGAVVVSPPARGWDELSIEERRGW